MDFIKTIDLIKKYHIQTKKKYGQNFLIDENIINKIIDSSSIDKDTGVIEIGPGLGSLTNILINKAKKVLCYEIDTNLVDILNKEYKKDNLIIINTDFLKVDLKNDINNYLKDCKKIIVIGNLPYYITTPILMKLFEIEEIKEYTLMMQKEVALRILAKPNTKEYSSLSIITQIKSEINKVLNVSKNVFIPKPEVESIVLNFKINPDRYNISNLDEFEVFLRNSFSQKRKTLLNNLYTSYNINKEELIKFLNLNNYNINIRAEEISINDFINLFNKFKGTYTNY